MARVNTIVASSQRSNPTGVYRIVVKEDAFGTDKPEANIASPEITLLGPPTVTWSHGEPSSSGVITVAGAWDQSVTGLTADDFGSTVHLSNGQPQLLTIQNLVIVPTTGAFTFQITPPSEEYGRVNLSINANAVTPSNCTQSYQFNYNTVSRIVISLHQEPLIPLGSRTIRWVGTVSHTNLTGFTVADIVSRMPSDVNVTFRAPRINQTTFAVTFGPFPVGARGTASFSIRANAFNASSLPTNIGNNLRTDAISVAYNFSASPTVDWTVPTGTQTDDFIVRGIWSQAVSDFTADDIMISQGSAPPENQVSIDNFTYSRSTRRFSFTAVLPSRKHESISFNIPANRVTPSNSATSSPIVTYNSEKLVTIDIDAGVINTGNRTISWLTTFSHDDLLGFDENDIIAVAPSDACVEITGTGRTRTITLSNIDNNTKGNASFTIRSNAFTPASLPDNYLNNVSTTSPVASYRFGDVIDVAWSNITGIKTGAFTVSGRWSRIVHGFDVTDLSVSSGTISNFTTDGNVYDFSFLLTPPSNSNGTITITIAAGRVSDSIANVAIPYAQTATVQYDTFTRANVTIAEGVQHPRGRSVSWDVTLSDSGLTGFDADDIISMTPTGLTASVTGGGTSYRVTLAGYTDDTFGTTSWALRGDAFTTTSLPANTRNNVETLSPVFSFDFRDRVNATIADGVQDEGDLSISWLVTLSDVGLTDFDADDIINILPTGLTASVTRQGTTANYTVKLSGLTSNTTGTAGFSIRSNAFSDLPQDHQNNYQIDAPQTIWNFLPVPSVVIGNAREATDATSDPPLSEESRFPGLLGSLGNEVVARTRVFYVNFTWNRDVGVNFTSSDISFSSFPIFSGSSYRPTLMSVTRVGTSNIYRAEFTTAVPTAGYASLFVPADAIPQSSANRGNLRSATKYIYFDNLLSTYEHISVPTTQQIGSTATVSFRISQSSYGSSTSDFILRGTVNNSAYSENDRISAISGNPAAGRRSNSIRTLTVDLPSNSHGTVNVVAKASTLANRRGVLGPLTETVFPEFTFDNRNHLAVFGDPLDASGMPITGTIGISSFKLPITWNRDIPDGSFTTSDINLSSTGGYSEGSAANQYQLTSLENVGTVGTRRHYEATIKLPTQMTSQATLTVSIPANAVSTGSSQASSTYNYLVSGAQASIVFTGVSGTKTGRFRIGVNFSRDVTGFDITDINNTSTNVRTESVEAVGGSARNYSVTFLPEPQINISNFNFSIAENRVTNPPGNRPATSPNIAINTFGTRTAIGPSITDWFIPQGVQTDNTFEVQVLFSEDIDLRTLTETSPGRLDYRASQSNEDFSITGTGATNVSFGEIISSEVSGLTKKQFIMPFTVPLDSSGVFNVVLKKDAVVRPGTPVAGPVEVQVSPAIEFDTRGEEEAIGPNAEFTIPNGIQTGETFDINADFKGLVRGLESTDLDITGVAGATVAVYAQSYRIGLGGTVFYTTLGPSASGTFGGNRLAAVDPEAGTITQIGSSTNFGIGATIVTGIARIGSQYYIYDVTTEKLHQLNISTGVATLITGAPARLGTTLSQYFAGLANLGTNLVTANEDPDRLVTVNPTTGRGTVAANSLSYRFTKGVAVLNNTIYAINVGSNLLTTIASDGNDIRVGNVNNFGVNETNPSGLLASGGQLWMIASKVGDDHYVKVYTLDHTTGQATLQFELTEPGYSAWGFESGSVQFPTLIQPSQITLNQTKFPGVLAPLATHRARGTANEYNLAFNRSINADMILPSDITFTGLPGLRVQNIDDQDNIYQLRVTPPQNSEGTLSIILNRNSVTDTEGNEGPSTDQNSPSVSFNTRTVVERITAEQPRGEEIAQLQYGINHFRVRFNRVLPTDTFTAANISTSFELIGATGSIGIPERTVSDAQEWFIPITLPDVNGGYVSFRVQDNAGGLTLRGFSSDIYPWGSIGATLGPTIKDRDWPSIIESGAGDFYVDIDFDEKVTGLVTSAIGLDAPESVLFRAVNPITWTNDAMQSIENQLDRTMRTRNMTTAIDQNVGAQYYRLHFTTTDDYGGEQINLYLRPDTVRGEA